MTIQSDRSQMQTHATGLQQGGQGLLNVSQAQQDDLTTVSGNSNAHEALTTAQSARQGIASAMTAMVTNLNSVVSGFEAVDQEIASQVSQGGS